MDTAFLAPSRPDPAHEANDGSFALDKDNDLWRGHFSAMASPCEILIDGGNETLARRLVASAHSEALRIERKWSRYRKDNIVWQINHATGNTIKVDDETAELITFADQCWRLSNGRFDVTSGILRKAWRFNGSDQLPHQSEIDALLPKIGWQKVTWNRPELKIPSGMEIDFGGIGKEYATDRILLKLKEITNLPLLINLGGDLAVSGPRRNHDPWSVGIEIPPDMPGGHDENNTAKILKIAKGALATSGDARRFLKKDGQRYGHILDPFTGWPVVDAPRSVTVAAGNCVEAGMLATLALLHGRNADQFLADQEVICWIQR